MRGLRLSVVVLCLLVGCIKDLNSDGIYRGVAEGASNTTAAALYFLGAQNVVPWPQGVQNQCPSSVKCQAINAAQNSETTADFTSVQDPQFPGYVIPTMQAHFPGDLSQNADVFILTSETNDANDAVKYASQITVTPQTVVDALVKMCNAITASGAVCFVTTANLPPNSTYTAPGPVYNFLIAENTLIKATFPAQNVIDFTTAFSDPSLYLFDGVHFNQDGQNLRASTAFKALVSYQP